MTTIKSKTTTVRRHTISDTINGIDHEFEVVFEPSEYNDIHIRISEDGMKAVVGYLCRDDDPSNPRKDWDSPVGTMVCFHSRYDLGDEHNFSNTEELFNHLCCEAVGDDVWERKLERAEKKCNDIYMAGDRTCDRGRREIARDEDAVMQELYNSILPKHYVILPLFLYDHSGITMSTGSFSCPWDSGQVGWIYADKNTILKEWGNGKVFTKQAKDKARKYLEGEVETYDQYLTGDVWGVCYQKFVNEGTAEEPEWDESRCDSRDECWGYYGDDYAEEELESGMKYQEEWLAEPLHGPEDPDQLELFREAV